jgi:uncharacterized protein
MAGEGAYVDTSVLGAYYCPEVLSGAAERAIRKLASPTISHLSEVEFCSLIAKKTRLKELKRNQARGIIDLFASHVADGFYRRIALTTEHFLNARTAIASMTTPLRTLDALHLAVAVSEQLAILTADLGFAQAAKTFKTKVLIVK